MRAIVGLLVFARRAAAEVRRRRRERQFEDVAARVVDRGRMAASILRAISLMGADGMRRFVLMLVIAAASRPAPMP